MQFHEVQLENIRSYTQTKVSFEKGSTLLIGDIGSGKSTLLLAIEFALFGLRRGELAGGGLLRHGTNEGSVTLHCTLQNKKVVIKRTLKRGKNGVQQNAGYIIVDGVKTDGTPVELKSQILTLLGYPDEFLTKSKSLLYRYTVYTPQEEMKAILFETPEDRLKTIRKIFDIDKYQKIKENASLYMKSLRAEQKVLKQLVQDADQIGQFLKEKKERKTIVTKEEVLLKQQLQTLQEEIQEHRKKQQALDEKRMTAEKMRQELTQKKDSLLKTNHSLEKNKEQQKILEESLALLKKQIEEIKDKKVNISDLKKQWEEREAGLRKKQNELLVEKTQQNTIINQAQKIMDQVRSLTTCPLCLQTVTEDHKHTIISVKQSEQEKGNVSIINCKEQEQMLLEQQKQLQSKKEAIQKLEKQIQQKELLQQKQEITQEQLNQKKKDSVELQKLQQEEKERIEELAVSLEMFADVQEQYKNAQQVLEPLQEKFTKLSSQHAALQKESELLEEQLTKLQEQVREQTKKKQTLQKITALHRWLDDYFIPVIDTIEKHVLQKIWQEFNATFQNWFDILLEDESILVQVDEAFTPVLQQNGYETTIEQLSGGEKTSVALAYRLSLHKVINEYISSIQTKGVIILDEPTDGFSAEQLDKMRDVLEQLQVDQSILVSHETKMESYVEHILRVQKNEHISTVTQ